MSADNYIYIDKGFKVWDCTASCVFDTSKGYYTGKDLLKQRGRLIAKCKTLQEACKVAQKQESEYGISFRLWCK